MTRVVIADDHSLYREGLKVFFRKEQKYELIGEATNGQELIELYREKQPDIVLTDIKMPEMDGIEATKEILKTDPAAAIVALSMFEEEGLVMDMLEAGAMGYLLKEASKEELLEGLDLVQHGKPCFSHTFSPRLIRLIAKSQYNPYHAQAIEVNEKEKQVIECIIEELTSKEIAVKLQMSARTVEWHKKRLMEKMDAKSTTGIVIYALKHNLVTI